MGKGWRLASRTNRRDLLGVSQLEASKYQPLRRMSAAGRKRVRDAPNGNSSMSDPSGGRRDAVEMRDDDDDEYDVDMDTHGGYDPADADGDIVAVAAAAPLGHDDDASPANDNTAVGMCFYPTLGASDLDDE